MGVVLALINDVVGDAIKDAVGGIHLNLPAYVLVPAAVIFLAVAGLVGQRLSDWAELLRRPADDVRVSEQVDEKAELLARERLRDKLRREYASMLEQSLIGEIPVEPAFDELPAAVERPLGDALERRAEAGAAPRRGTPRMAYDKQGGSTGDGLLILGDAGTGKSVALVKLALDVAKRAESDPLQPLPVYVTLSSWKTGREFAAWFAEQAQRLHGIRPSVARRWLRAGMLVPFLDGLDEIRDPDDRVACVAAINALRQDADLGVVVTCRQADYLELRKRLRLGTALVIRRLDADGLLGDLRAGGPALAGVLSAAERDAGLLELIRTPLMLGVTLIAYRGREVDAPQATGSASRYDHVLTAYVNRRFETREQQRPGRGDYPRERTTRWLAMIASNLDRRNDSAFFVDRLQPDWVPSTRVMHIVGAAPGIVGGGLAAAIVSFPFLILRRHRRHAVNRAPVWGAAHVARVLAPDRRPRRHHRDHADRAGSVVVAGGVGGPAAASCRSPRSADSRWRRRRGSRTDRWRPPSWSSAWSSWSSCPLPWVPDSYRSRSTRASRRTTGSGSRCATDSSSED